MEGGYGGSLGKRLGWEVDGTDSGLSQVVDLGISDVQPLGSTTRHWKVTHI
jgi:hypothetical protein